MTTKQKTVNYDEATTKKVSDAYLNAIAGYPDNASEEEKWEIRKAAVAEICAFTGKTEPSVRSKLGSLNIYVGKPDSPKAKTGKKTTKEDLKNRISELGGQKNQRFFDSIEGANKSVLEYVIKLQEKARVDANMLGLKPVREVVQAIEAEIQAERDAATQALQDAESSE